MLPTPLGRLAGIRPRFLVVVSAEVRLSAPGLVLDEDGEVVGDLAPGVVGADGEQVL